MMVMEDEDTMVVEIPFPERYPNFYSHVLSHPSDDNLQFLINQGKGGISDENDVIQHPELLDTIALLESKTDGGGWIDIKSLVEIFKTKKLSALDLQYALTNNSDFDILDQDKYDSYELLAEMEIMVDKLAGEALRTTPIAEEDKGLKKSIQYLCEDYILQDNILIFNSKTFSGNKKQKTRSGGTKKWGVMALTFTILTDTSHSDNRFIMLQCLHRLFETNVQISIHDMHKFVGRSYYRGQPINPQVSKLINHKLVQGYQVQERFFCGYQTNISSLKKLIINNILTKTNTLPKDIISF